MTRKIKIVQERVKVRSKYVYSHLYECYCGKQFVAEAHSVKSGHTQSCGCLGKQRRLEANTKHGLHLSREYASWESMKQRCSNPAATGYAHYGARGITFCPQWQSFDVFYSDMGTRPPGTSLDRIDVNGNYEPTNCRWADQSVQLLNRRKRHAGLNPRMTIKERNLIRGAIRRIFGRSKVRNDVIDKTKVSGYVDLIRPRVKTWYMCSKCGHMNPKAEIAVDHILPVVPLNVTTDAQSMEEFIDRLWCDPTNLQAICKNSCHHEKTQLENKQRRAYKKANKKT